MIQQNINTNTNTNTNLNVDVNLNDHQLTEETLGLVREGITSFSAATPHLCYFVQDSSELFFLKGELLAAGEKIAFTKTQQKENPYLFYELPSLEVGKIILKQLFNKRFLKNEHSYFNISDPLDGWWLERNQKTLTLWFRNKGRSFLGEKNRPQMDKSYLSPLGPIGDSSLFSQFLRPLKNSFSSSFSSPVEIFLEEKSCQFSFQEEDLLLASFEKLFLEGVCLFHSKDFLFSSQALAWQSFILLLEELAIVRTFWLKCVAKFFYSTENKLNAQILH